MKQTTELLVTGFVETFEVPKPISVRDLMKEKGIDEAMKNFGLLLNGKNVDLDTIIELGDKFVILPHLKGG